MHACPQPLVIFDFDGTLADSKHAISALFNVSLCATGFAAVPEERIWQRIGLSLAVITEELTGFAPGHERHERFVQDYRERCFAGGLAHVRYFDGIAALLEGLRADGRTLAIATGKAMRGLLENLTANGGQDGFACLATSDRVANGKPMPDLVELVLAETGFSNDDAVLVGDTTHDVLMGRAAGVTTIAVSYGAHDAALLESSGPDHVAHSVAELQTLLLGAAARA